MKNRRNEFYKDLDLYKDRKISCGCTSIAIFFILLIIVGEFLVFSFFDDIRFNPKIQTTRNPVGEISSLQTIGLSQSEREIVVPQGLLNLAISEALSRDLSTIITQEGIEISGKIGYLLPSNATVKLYPEVVDGDLAFKVVSVKIGHVGVAKSLAFNVSPQVKRALNKKINRPENYHLEAAILSEAVMRLVYRENGN